MSLLPSAMLSPFSSCCSACPPLGGLLRSRRPPPRWCTRCGSSRSCGECWERAVAGDSWSETWRRAARTGECFAQMNQECHNISIKISWSVSFLFITSCPLCYHHDSIFEHPMITKKVEFQWRPMWEAYADVVQALRSTTDVQTELKRLLDVERPYEAMLSAGFLFGLLRIFFWLFACFLSSFVAAMSSPSGFLKWWFSFDNPPSWLIFDWGRSGACNYSGTGIPASVTLLHGRKQVNGWKQTVPQKPQKH